MKNKIEVTEQDVICTQIARGVDFWLRDIGNKINEYEDRESVILEVVEKYFIAGKKLAETHKESLNGKMPKWIVSVLYNEGYGKQCMEMGPFEVETKEEAKKLCEEKLTEMFSDSPNTDIIDLKIKRYSH